MYHSQDRAFRQIYTINEAILQEMTPQTLQSQKIKNILFELSASQSFKLRSSTLKIITDLIEMIPSILLKKQSYLYIFNHYQNISLGHNF